MKRLLLLVLCFAAPAFGQLPYSADAQSGYAAGPSCTNSNTAMKITTVVIGGVTHDVFCTPSGHVLYIRGSVVSSLSDSSAQHPDESGTTVEQYRLTKHGSSASYYSNNHKRVQSWGWNALGQYADQTERTGGITPAMPFAAFNIVSVYSLTNKLGWGTGPAKEIYYLLARSDWPGSQLFAAHADWFDPNVAGMAAGTFVNSSSLIALAAASTATKNLLLGFYFDDADNTHCLGAGPDFPTTPTGHADHSCGAVGVFLPPVNYANSAQGEIYTDATVYWKKSLHDALVTTHTNVSGLNTSWGSTYTSMGTSGECVGTQPAYVTPCGSTVGAETAYTGNGVTCAFTGYSAAHTTVSKFSLGVFVAGVLVGGDTGSGALYGPELTGTINYATGAFAPTFAGGHCPANAAAVTIAYIANGWGIGTGFLDEAGQNTGWIGRDVIAMSDFSAGSKVDINAHTTTTASFYATEMRSALNTWSASHGFTGNIPFFGAGGTGTWSGTPSKYVVAGLCGNVDAIALAGQIGPTQAMINDVDAACPGLPLIQYLYTTATADSEFRWVNSTTVHNSGKSVTSTFATPSKLAVATLVDSHCADTSFNTLQTRPASNTSNTLTYNATNTPGSGSTTCTVELSDNNNGGYLTQALRGAAEAATISFNLTARGATSHVAMFLGYSKWNMWPDWDDVEWGPTTYRDNTLDGGTEDVNAVVSCSAPLAALNCGGELALHGPPYGNFIGPIKTANASIDTFFLSSGSVSAVPVSENFGSINVNVTSASQTATITNNSGSTITLTGNSLTIGTNFSIVGGSSCAGTLANGSTCTVSATFTPLSLGALTDTLNVAFTGASGSPVTVVLSGLGTAIPAPVPQMLLSYNVIPSLHTACPAKCPELCLGSDGLFYSVDCKTWQHLAIGTIPTTALIPEQTVTLH